VRRATQACEAILHTAAKSKGEQWCEIYAQISTAGADSLALPFIYKTPSGPMRRARFAVRKCDNWRLFADADYLTAPGGKNAADGGGGEQQWHIVVQLEVRVALLSVSISNSTYSPIHATV
jgi:hypothetical protein